MYTKPDFLNRQRFQQGHLAERGSTDFASWAKESFEIATKDHLPEWRADRDSERRQHGLRDDRSGSRASCGIRCYCEPDC